jgi:hypothetical protein
MEMEMEMEAGKSRKWKMENEKWKMDDGKGKREKGKGKEKRKGKEKIRATTDFSAVTRARHVAVGIEILTLSTIRIVTAALTTILHPKYL